MSSERAVVMSAEGQYRPEMGVRVKRGCQGLVAVGVGVAMVVGVGEMSVLRSQLMVVGVEEMCVLDVCDPESGK